MVAGYVGSKRQWKLVERPWQAALREFPAEEFHATDFFSGREPYCSWQGHKRRRFLATLVSILTPRRALHPIGAAINVPAFNSFSVGQRRYLTYASIRSGRFLNTGLSGVPKRHPYTTAFGIFLDVALERVPEDCYLDFVFDRNKVEEGYAKQVFEHFKKSSVHPDRNRMNSISFEDSRSCAGLQAADLYAYLCNSKLTRRADMSAEQQRALRALTRKRRHCLEEWNKPELVMALSSLSPEDQQAAKAHC